MTYGKATIKLLISTTSPLMKFRHVQDGSTYQRSYRTRFVKNTQHMPTAKLSVKLSLGSMIVHCFEND